MVISVRLDLWTERLVERIVRETGRTRSEIVREALARLVQERESRPEPESPYAALRPFIGCAHGGPQDLSAETGSKFARVLRRGRAQ
jgi:Arc/MetJ-type ribon-helix-helix transcriptional regulator